MDKNPLMKLVEQKCGIISIEEAQDGGFFVRSALWRYAQPFTNRN